MKVLKFGAVWCNGCLVMRPRWQEIEKENPWLKTAYYDADKDREMVKRYAVESNKLPTFIFLDKKDKELERLHGEISQDKIRETIQKYRDK